MSQLKNLIVGYGSSTSEAFRLTIIPLPELTLNVVADADVIRPPCNRPVYRLPSNQRRRVVFVNGPLYCVK